MIIVSATTIFAPEEIPRTNGPAMGLAKNVCKRKPDKDKAPPSIAAIRILGRRILQIILYSVAAPSRRKRILRILGTEICTFPVLILSTTVTANAITSPENTAMYLALRLRFSP